MFIPYTYLIGWSKFNYWYYGVEYSQRQKIANPSNLFTIYFTSSKYVSMARTLFGDPDIIQIRKTFKTSIAARNWEHKVLRRLKVSQNPKWINVTDNKAIVNTPENIRKNGLAASIRFKGKPKTPQHIANLKLSKQLNPRRYTDKQKYELAIRSSNVSKETRDKRSKSMSKLFWVTNGIVDRRVQNIPEGFVLGRANFVSPSLDLTIYRFIHKTGDTFIGSRKELVLSYPTHKIVSTELGLMIRGKYKSHRGWSLT